MTSATAPLPRTAERRRRRRRARVVSRYRDDAGAAREIVARPGSGGSVLLVDRGSGTPGTELLIAHLAADEPAANAAIAAASYLAAPPARRRCRALETADELSAPFESPDSLPASRDGAPAFQLRLVTGAMSIPALRWTRRTAAGSQWTALSLREVIAATESYEPYRDRTRRALERHAADPEVSTTVLRAEFARVLASPIVLNRALREAVLDRVADGGTSLSEIAMRCGRCKQDPRGNQTGETSWLARRVGLLPEGGQSAPTRWVHSDVLALIARDGLGIAPREVELG